MPQIRVHERALAHLSRGLYRSPASAIRELVSNAWDANATRVTIDTNYPTFYQLSIEDNGEGFSRDEFEELMSGGIGNSSKRTKGRALRYGRPTIGRLGIGMLGVAQICGSFVVTSKPISGEAFRATVTLYDNAKARMDEPDSDLVLNATSTVGGEEIKSTIVEVGTYEIEEFDGKDLEHGTRILAGDIQPTFTAAFQDSLGIEGYKPVPLDWRSAVKTVLNAAPSLQLLGDYWRLLWELAAACPIPYLADDAVPASAVKEINEALQGYNFLVIVDGRELVKPVLLKGNPDGYTTQKIPRTTIRVYGENLTYEGYICVQEGKQLRPDELRGVLIRIKNIGIGYYDQSMLDYRVNQGPRSRWVTGEIYVIEGLENALNIDRDSFNRFHPEFRALQEAVHSILQKDIFRRVYEKLTKRSESRRVAATEKRNEALKTAIKSQEKADVKVSEINVSKSSKEPYSSSRQTSEGIEVSVARSENLPVPKSSRQLVQSIMAIFEVAQLQKSDAERRERFSELLIALLKHW